MCATKCENKFRQLVLQVMTVGTIPELEPQPHPVQHFKTSVCFSTPHHCFILAQKRGTFRDLQRHVRLDQHSDEDVISFVLQTNIAEGIGTQVLAATEAAIRRGNNDRPSLETKGVYEGVCYLLEYEAEAVTVQEGKEVHGKYLTPALIQELHRRVMKHADPRKAGKVRKSIAETVKTTRTNDSVHEYLDGHWVPNALFGLCDLYNAELRLIMKAHDKSGSFPRLISLVGWFFFHFLNIHPFFDGNGRIGRLLAAYMLRAELPRRLIPLTGDREMYLRSLELAHKETGHPSEAYYPLDHIEYVTQSVIGYMDSARR